MINQIDTKIKLVLRPNFKIPKDTKKLKKLIPLIKRILLWIKAKYSKLDKQY